MSWRMGGGKPFTTATATGSSSSSSSKSKNVADNAEQLSRGVADIALDSPQDDANWEVVTRKPKNRAGSSVAKQSLPQNSNPKPWGPHSHSHGPQKLAARNTRPATGGNSSHSPSTPTFETANRAPQSINVIAPPLQHGWNWQSRAANSNPCDNNVESDKENESDDDDDNDDILEDYTDDELFSDEFDSDTSEKSHDTVKKSKWFAKFFETMDDLKIVNINDPERRRHCPACRGGPGSIDWYRGLQALLTHAKTKGRDRMKLHRKFAQVLEEELQRRGVLIVPPGEAFGQWEGLKDEQKDYQIVWPPMVIIMNTQLEQCEDEKWIGMGSQELLEYFEKFHPMKARHSYGPKGHRGMSVLIFEASARGYLEAERLHKHFLEKGTDRNAWNQRRPLHYSGGKRLLYGFLALKEELVVFNQHSQGKSKLKYEMRSYQGVFVDQIRQMSEDNQKLTWYKDKLVKEQRHSKGLEESLDFVSQKLHKTMEENRIVRQRTKMQQEENKEEMYLQEQFFKDQMMTIHELRDENDENFERLQQEEREKVKQSNANTVNADEIRQRGDEIAKFIKTQEKEMGDYVEEREMLIKAHEEKINAMKKQYWEEEVKLEKKLNAGLVRLMEKYSPLHSKDSGNY